MCFVALWEGSIWLRYSRVVLAVVLEQAQLFPQDAVLWKCLVGVELQDVFGCCTRLLHQCTLIELVETEKVPIVGKLGWYIDMKKRDAAKPLPKFLFRMMGLVSTEKVRD